MAQDIAPSQPNLWPYILPTVLVLGACTLYPIATVLWMSLHDWTWGGDSIFSGVKNYRLLWLKGSFVIALVNTFTFAVSAVLVELVLGMILALAANRVTRGAGLFRVLMILPLMVSGIAVSLVWKVLLDPTFGVINAALGAVGLPEPNWLGATTGFLLTKATMGMLLQGVDKMLPGLGHFYMAGQWVEPGGMVPTAAMSGRQVIQLICHADEREFTTATA